MAEIEFSKGRSSSWLLAMRSAALLFVGAVLLLPTASFGCMCQYWKDPGFLTGDSVQLPVDAVGIPWWGHFEMEGQKLTLPDKSRFLVERVSAVNTVDVVDFELRWLEGSLTSIGSASRRDGLVLVVPKNGMEPGRYRFTYNRYSSYLPAPPTGVERQVVWANVTNEALPPSIFLAGCARLGAGPAVHSEIFVESPSRCSERLEGSARRIWISLPSELKKWGEAFLYTVFVDGEIWRPSESYCDIVPPGYLSSREREIAVVFSVGSEQERDAVEQLAWHTVGSSVDVQIVAWLPGTSFRLSASQMVEIASQSAPECE